MKQIGKHFGTSLFYLCFQNSLYLYNEKEDRIVITIFVLKD